MAAEILASCTHVLSPSLLARAEWLRTAVPGAGTLEIQFDFPAAPVADGDTEYASVDSMLLMLQLQCRDRQWPHVVRTDCSVHHFARCSHAFPLLSLLEDGQRKYTS